MIEFIVAVDPRPNTKARHFVSVAQALGRVLIRPCCHARKRDRFSAHRKYQQILDRLDLLRHVAPPFTHFSPRRANNKGETALRHAARNGYEDVVELLLHHGCRESQKPDATEDRSASTEALRKAAEDG